MNGWQNELTDGPIRGWQQRSVLVLVVVIIVDM